MEKTIFSVAFEIFVIRNICLFQCRSGIYHSMQKWDILFNAEVGYIIIYFLFILSFNETRQPLWLVACASPRLQERVIRMQTEMATKTTFYLFETASNGVARLQVFTNRSDENFMVAVIKPEFSTITVKSLQVVVLSRTLIEICRSFRSIGSDFEACFRCFSYF